MNNQIKVKKPNISAYPFDQDQALAEARNAEHLFDLHLSRCDSADAATRLANIFKRLGRKFEGKKLALSKEVV